MRRQHHAADGLSTLATRTTAAVRAAANGLVPETEPGAIRADQRAAVLAAVRSLGPQWTAETVCSTYKVPAYMVGVAAPPAYNNVEALNLQYYTQCLQNPIESIELLLDEGLSLPAPYGTEFDLDDLLRMDTASQIKAAAEAIGGGGMSPNEARQRFLNLGPVTGGETPFLQQQNYSLAALAKRDAKADPFEGRATLPAPAVPPAPETRSLQRAELHLLTAAAIERRTA